jgi:hypothetical protein
MNIAQMLHQDIVKGDVGIEIEVEGVNLPHYIGPHWNVHEDGSLRGESYEYVTNGPVCLENVGLAMDVLNNAMFDSVVNDSPRCGVHIHINVQEMTFEQLCSFMVLYLCFEEVLVKWCGPDRVGNLFCLRVSDASGGLGLLEDFMVSKRMMTLHTDAIRYGSMNPKSVVDHGSLEFRAMRGTVDKQLICDWVGMLSSIKEYAMRYNPQELIGSFSIKGAQDFFNDVLAPYRDALNPSTYDMMIGMRNAQELAFCRKWGDKVVVVKPKPLGAAQYQGQFHNIPQMDLRNEVAVDQVEARLVGPWNLVEEAPERD